MYGSLALQQGNASLCASTIGKRHRYDGKRKQRAKDDKDTMRSRADITWVVETHANAVLRACALYLHEKADREDAFQETFLRYAHSNTDFADEEHRKAWLIRVAINVCKDMLKSARMKVESLDDMQEQGMAFEGDDGRQGQTELEAEVLVRALNQLEERYRVPLYLKYYEGYTASQIAQATGVPENTVYTNISRGKQQLLRVMSHE